MKLELNENSIMLQSTFDEYYPHMRGSDAVCFFEIDGWALAYIPVLQMPEIGASHRQKSLRTLQSDYDDVRKTSVQLLYQLSESNGCTLQDVIDDNKAGFDLIIDSESSD